MTLRNGFQIMNEVDRPNFSGPLMSGQGNEGAYSIFRSPTTGIEQFPRLPAFTVVKGRP